MVSRDFRITLSQVALLAGVVPQLAPHAARAQHAAAVLRAHRIVGLQHGGPVHRTVLAAIAPHVLAQHPPVLDGHDRALRHVLQRRVRGVAHQHDVAGQSVHDRVAVVHPPPTVPPHVRQALLHRLAHLLEGRLQLVGRAPVLQTGLGALADSKTATWLNISPECSGYCTKWHSGPR